jgi:predicted phosphodiesterase
VSITEIGALAVKEIRRHPEASNTELGRYLVRKYPGVFRNVEYARFVVRYWRDRAGEKNRKRKKSISMPKLSVPEPVANDWAPFPLPIDSGFGVILSDLHMPYHDKNAVEIALRYALNHGATDFVILNGDIIDCYRLSRFEKDPTARSFAEELSILKDFVGELKRLWKLVIYKLGNHENRLERYLRISAPELYGVPSLTWASFLGEDKNVVVVRHDVPIYVGKLNIFHGHEFGGLSSPVNPARTIYLKARECALVGHWHRSSTHTEVSARGAVITTWSIGCLCSLHPEYARVNSWTHGFAFLEISNKTNFRVNTFRILGDGTVYST